MRQTRAPPSGPSGHHLDARGGGACLEDPRVLTARVRIEKPEALEGAAAAGVEVVAARG